MVEVKDREEDLLQITAGLEQSYSPRGILSDDSARKVLLNQLRDENGVVRARNISTALKEVWNIEKKYIGGKYGMRLRAYDLIIGIEKGQFNFIPDHLEEIRRQIEQEKSFKQRSLLVRLKQATLFKKTP